jgi:CRP-like cAMP-binding protein
MEETCVSRKSALNPDEKIFFYGEIVKKKIGEHIFCPGEDNNCMYVLIYGSIGVFRNNSLIATYKNKGDLIGTVAALLNHASGYKKNEPRKNEVKALSYSRLLRIKAEDFNFLVKNNPDLVLHVTRTLAENLKEGPHEYSEIQKSTEKMIERFSLCCDSCAREVQNIFAMFLKKTELAQECSAELKILNHLPEMIDNSYRELCTKTTILNTKTDQKGNCAICL